MSDCESVEEIEVDMKPLLLQWNTASANNSPTSSAEPPPSPPYDPEDTQVIEDDENEGQSIPHLSQ